MHPTVFVWVGMSMFSHWLLWALQLVSFTLIILCKNANMCSRYMKQTWEKSPFLGRLREKSGNPVHVSMCISGVVVVVLLFKWYCLDRKEEVELVWLFVWRYLTDTSPFLHPHTVTYIYTFPFTQLPSKTTAFSYCAISSSSREMKGSLKSISYNQVSQSEQTMMFSEYGNLAL